MADFPATAKQVFSTVTSDGKVTLDLREVAVSEPGEHDVVIKIEAAPLNPSDFAVLFAFADPDSFEQGGDAQHPSVSAPIPAPVMPMLERRVGRELPVGNEGAGVVVAAGSSPMAQALLGKTVAVLGQAMYAEYITVNAMLCMPVADDVKPEECAAALINPYTVLGMIETMKQDGFSGLVHTAAASAVGQMLIKVCADQDIPLVNIVRRPEQVELLRSLGARYVCDSSQPSFEADLQAAIHEAGTYMAFDAVGGSLADTILRAMERAVLQDSDYYSVYGSKQKKCLYSYGKMDLANLQVSIATGFAWRTGGWLMTTFLEEIGLERLVQLRETIASQVTTTFASRFEDQLTLEQMLSVDNIRQYAKATTGKKYLVTP